MVLESTTKSLEGKVTSSVKGARVMVESNAGSAVGDGKGGTVSEGACVGVGGGAGVGVSVWVGIGVGASVAVGLGVSVGVEGEMVTIVGEASAVAVGAEVAESLPQAISRTRIRPKRPSGAAPRNGIIILTGFLATGFLIADWDGLSAPGYRDMHFPPNTSSYSSYYKRSRLDAIADESASYVKIGGSTLE
jgi:hypothetical protein